MIYYKATKRDGTDFRTGTVDYLAALETGESLPLLTSLSGSYKCCTDTVYHASDVAAKTLIGCSWPCRLFEVEGEPVDQEGHKFGFRTMKVVREIEAWKALGPNGEAVAALIEKAKTLTADEVARISAAGSAAANAAGSAAANAAWRAAANAAWRAAANAAWDAAGNAAWDDPMDAAWSAAGNAAGHAARALVARDLISEEHFNILYEPWGSVMD